MSVWGYLKRNISDYFYAAAVVLAVSFALSQSPSSVLSVSEREPLPVIILDPGHGGSDGGTQTRDGVPESRINLEVSQRVSDLIKLMGMQCMMTRQADVSLDTQGNTVREKKNSDLRNRVQEVNGVEKGILISIHQNHFPQTQYSGPQVFYASVKGSEELAKAMQIAMNAALAPQSNRMCKSAQGIYLMEHIRHPGILIECGFLSNLEEAQKLMDPDYQNKLAAVIAAAACEYVLRSDFG